MDVNYLEEFVSNPLTGKSTVLRSTAALVIAAGVYGILKLWPAYSPPALNPGAQTAQPQISEQKAKNSGSNAQPSSTSNQGTANSASSFPLAEIPGKTYPIQNLASEFASLSGKAEHGDLKAARTLAQALQTCSGVPKTFEELDKAVANANRPNLAPNWADLEQYDLAYKKSLFNQCVGTTPEEVATHAKWIGLLAEAGDAEARLEYVAAARPTDYMAADYSKQLDDYKKNAPRYIQSEIDAGNPNGLLTMALQYEAFQFSSQNSDGTIGNAGPLFAPDPVKAYTYFYAYALSGGDANNSTVTILASLQGQLTPAQLQAATAAGTQIYNKCCKTQH